jgi:DNA repair protein RecN (Recombination protein N)
LIERIYIKEYLHLNDIELHFSPGLNLFTGPSGAGKSVFMDAVLSTFGLKDAQNNSMVEIDSDTLLDLSAYGLESDETQVFKQIKKEKSRYFLNNQSVSKKTLAEIANSFISFLSLRDYSEFENASILALIDAIVAKQSPEHSALLDRYHQLFEEYKEVDRRLSLLKEQEEKINDLIDYTRFEIEKIDSVAPKEGEYEELMEVKKRLSKKDKIEESLSKAQLIFESEKFVGDLFELSDSNGSFFDEAMNELRLLFDDISEKLGELDDIDIESTLTRIEALSDLIRKYGSIEEALLYRDKKAGELEGYIHSEEEIGELTARKEVLTRELEELAGRLSDGRFSIVSQLNNEMNTYLDMLYLSDGEFVLEKTELSYLGSDHADFCLKSNDLKKISTGEFNRVRLAFLAVRSSYFERESGILFLDEIDANLSGKESMSVAKVLKKLSLTYQIFSISHQPQLSSTADAHFIVYKHDDVGHINILQDEQRVSEIARIISGENITAEAVDFARKLLEEAKSL